MKLTGQLVATTEPVRGASSYNTRVARAAAPTTYVQTLQTTGARVEINGLTPGELYNVEINAVGAAGASDYSVPGQARAL